MSHTEGQPAVEAEAGRGGDGTPIGWEDMDMGKFLLLGACISVTCDLTLYPFDVIKTRLQASGKQAAAYPKYTGTIHAWRTMAKMEGRRGLYRGFSITALGYLPSDILYYSTYEFGKHTMQTKYDKLQSKFSSLPDRSVIEPAIHLSMGGLAEMCSSAVWMPVDIVAQKLMVQGPLKAPKYSSPRHAIKKIWHADGLRGFYRGFLATMLTYSSQSAVSWGVYESARKLCHANYPPFGFGHELHAMCHNAGLISHRPCAEPVEKMEWLIHVGCGTLAGAVAAVLTNPLDVIKTRLQIQEYHSKAMECPEDFQAPKYSTMRGMAAGIMQEEGLVGFSRGMWARVLYLAPVSAFTFVTYELLKSVAKIDPELLEPD